MRRGREARSKPRPAPRRSALACHVGDWDAIPGFVDAVVERFGRIDVLVNNAGINPARVDVGRHDARRVAQDLLRQPRGPAAHGAVRRAAHARQGGGSIINIASMAAYSGGPTGLRLRRVEGGARQPHQEHGQEWAPWNIRVNVLSPGPVPQRDGRRRRTQRPRVHGHDRRRHAAASGSPSPTRSSARCSTWRATRRRSSPATTSPSREGCESERELGLQQLHPFAVGVEPFVGWVEVGDEEVDAADREAAGGATLAELGVVDGDNHLAAQRRPSHL